jgi:bifunctional UDP-N-acetylglucosamine pyrophosphorylase/glucosamine-1-phosphate N-acetyltransferase
MQRKMNIVILAAGQGKRMRSDLPKVLHPLAGRPLLAHVLGTAAGLNPESICVVYGHGGEAVREALVSAAPNLNWARQEPQLGTGHALMQALPYLKDSAQTLVLYGDVPLTRLETLRRLCEAAGNNGKAGLGLLTIELDDPTGYGRIVRQPQKDGGCVTRIVEQKDASATELAIREVNTGIMAIPTARLKTWLEKLGNDNTQKEYYLTDIVALAVAEGVPVVTAHPDAAWETLGVNSRSQMAALERIYQRNIAEHLLEAGVALADPARLDVRGTLLSGKDCYIDINCVFEGNVIIGDGVSIGPNCVLKDVRIAAGTRIEAFCHIDSAEIGARCSLGPYARIRPATVLDEEVHIGNFVEVKASHIGAGTKAGHLSYLGDASLGRNVNVGAGTITCNYDGANKHRTVIEDDVFIGSDTQLIAPVRVGRGATLAAGTTLSKDAPEGQLTLSRVEQKSVRGWKRPIKKK